MKRAIVLAIFVILLASMPFGTALAQDAAKPSSATPSETVLATILTIVMSVIFIAACVLLNVRSALADGDESPWPAFALMAAVAVAIRIIAALVYEGYATDIACFKGWALSAYGEGPARFYTDTELFVDYPPGYIYVLWAVGLVRDVFSIDWTSALFTLVIKLPSVIAEVATAAVVFRAARKELGKTFALLCAAFVLFNPAFFFNSSVWGQVDAFFTLFAVLCICWLKKDNPWLGAAFFAAALLIKPQALILAPVVGLYYVYALFKKGNFKRGLLGIFGGGAIGASVFALGVLPFTGAQSMDWILHKYAGTVESYQYATINAFNFFALTGGNWISFDSTLWFLPYRVWGIIFIVLICALTVFLQWRSRDEGHLFDLAGFVVISVFMLGHAMHERYIMPACILLIFAYVYSRDAATLFFAAAFSMTALLNQMVVLYADSVLPSELPTLLISGVNVALYIAYFMVTVKKLASRRVLIKSPAYGG